jgi:hypothetical protein
VGSDFVGGENIKFKIKKYDDSEEKIDMVYSSLKYYGKPITIDAENNLKGLLKEKNIHSNFYSQLIKDQKDMITEQQNQIKSLNERVQMLEKLLFNFTMKNRY